MAVAVWTPKAKIDLEEILYYIRVTAGRPLTAQRIGEEIVTVAERQAQPSAAELHHPATPPEWRYVRLKRWLIFYQPHQRGIEVTRVIDGSRDLPRALYEVS